MLRKIIIKNCRGFEGEYVIDFSKREYTYLSEMIIEDVVNPIYIYGDNSSGKTSILNSIYTITTNLVTNVETLALDTNSNLFNLSEPSEITLEFMYQNRVFEYTNIYNLSSKNKIVKEVLICDGEEIFNKENLDILFLRQDSKVESLIAFKYLSSIISANQFMVITNLNKKLTKLIETTNDEINVLLDDIGQVPKLKIKLEENVGEERLVFDYVETPTNYNWSYLNLTSTGTQKLYAFLAVVCSLEPGSLILVDEIDAHFNPKLLVKLSKILNERKIQVIATSHNTYNLKTLRPDQVFETKNEKNKLYINRLSDLNPKVRANHNMEKLFNGGYFAKDINTD